MDREILGLGSDITLPSKGLLYDGQVIGGRVQIMPMTTREEKMIASAGTNAGMSIIDTLINRCVEGAGTMKADDFLVGDRAYLIMAIRAVSLGEDYEFSLQCESCNTKSRQEVQIPEDLSVISLKDGFEEPIAVELPYSKWVVKLRLLRGADEKDIARYSERAYRNINAEKQGDPSYTYRIAKQIVSINPNPEDEEAEIVNEDAESMKQICALYEKLPARDGVAIRNALSENDCGVDTDIEYRCPKCGYTGTMMLPMQVEFFRPGGNRGVRYL